MMIDDENGLQDMEPKVSEGKHSSRGPTESLADKRKALFGGGLSPSAY